MNKQPLIVDTETSFETFQRLAVITICELGGEPEIAYSYAIHGAEVPQEVIERLSDRELIAHNAVFDIPLLQKAGVRVGSVFCTMIAEYALSGGNAGSFKSLKDLIKQYCNVELNKEARNTNWFQKLTAEQINYCLADVMYLSTIYEEQNKLIDSLGCRAAFHLKMLVVKYWSLDLYSGLVVDPEKRKELSYLLKKEYNAAFEKLLNSLPVKLFINKAKLNGKTLMNYSLMANQYNTTCEIINKIPSGKTKELVETYDYDLWKPFLLMNPDNDILLDIGQGGFIKNVFHYFNIISPTYDKAFVENFLEENSDHPAAEVIRDIAYIKKISKMSSSYVKDEDSSIATVGDELRMRGKFTMTNTGRIGIYPFNQIAAPDENKIDLQNALSTMFVPPKGHVILSADYSSIEAIAGAVFYKDTVALDSINRGIDPHLKCASVLFGFEYNNPDQTKALKEQYKSLRQAVKGAVFASAYGAGKNKMFQSVSDTAKKAGIDVTFTVDEVYDAVRSLTPGIASSQDNMANFIGETVYTTLTSLVRENSWESDIIRHSGYDKTQDPTFNKNARTANAIRTKLLKEDGLFVKSRNCLGLFRAFPAYRDFYNVSEKKQSVRVTQLINFPIQSHCALVMDLAIVLIKKRYPQYAMPITIYDSICLYIPENEATEELKEDIVKIMKHAFYIIFNSDVKVDLGYTKEGFKS